jgi:type III pantothenate kinase
MTPDIVVDIGNSRMKWGWVDGGKVHHVVPLGDDPATWDVSIDLTRDAPVNWAAASVNPPRLQRFAEWVRNRGERLVVIDDFRRLPLRVDVDEPGAVGIDRLLACLAARRRVEPDRPAIVISAGTAVTVDLIDETDTFRGGAILPGPWLMARSLHQYTAKLPLVELHEVPSHDPPGRNTRDAITVGIMAALMGACQVLVDEYAALCSRPPAVLMTGGAIGYLIDYDFAPDIEIGGPYPLVLEGVRLAAEAMG